MPKLLLLWCVLFCTIQGFSQFREVYKGSDDFNNITGLSFLTPSTGFASFNKFIGYTADSGHTFAKRYVSYDNTDFNGYTVTLTFGFNASGVKAFSKDSLIVYGDYGSEPSILFSANGGQSWKVVFHQPVNPNATNFSDGVTDMQFPGNTAVGFAVEHEMLLRTANRGQSWSIVAFYPNKQLKKLSFATLDNGFAIGGASMYKTTDKGISWQPVILPLVNNVNGDYNAVFFRTGLFGYISDMGTGSFFKTADGGATWQQMNDLSLADGVGGHDMVFTNDSTGFMGTKSFYHVYKTTDSGRTWQRCVRDNNYQYLYYGMNSLYFLDEKTGWAGGAGEYLMLTTDSGAKTYPAALFKIDTTNLYATSKVTLANYSKPAWHFKWLLNGTLLSTAYNALYTHIANRAADTIVLIATNDYGADTLIKYAYFNVPQPPPTYTGWAMQQTGINDNLLDVKFYGDFGVVTTAKGSIYYTTTGWNDKTGWKKFVITANASDSLLLERVKFKHTAFNDREPIFYVCGNDTINKKAVLLQINLLTGAYAFKYTGAVGSAFNAIGHTNGQGIQKGSILAVGSGGLKVLYNTDFNTLTASNFPDKKNLIDVIQRDGPISTVIGILSDSTLYVCDIVGNLTYTAPLNTKAVAGVNFAGNGNFIISDSILHHLVVSPGEYIHDSITATKAKGLRYTSVAKSGFAEDNGTFIGTTTGIYRVIYLSGIAGGPLWGKEAIEYQPSSQHKKINNIWFNHLQSADTGYAAGDKGVLMRTVSYGGLDVPYSTIYTDGVCAGDYLYLTGFNGSGTSCAWYLDNKFVVNNCISGTIIINTPGAHTLQYVVSNGYGLTDTTVKTINITTPPAINLSLAASDTILCKQEPLILTIQNTEADFKYALLQDSTNTSFGYANSTGGLIYIKTSPISVTGNYFVRVTSNNSNCVRDFTDRLHVNVEHTKSAFTAGKINLAVGQGDDFYAHSTEAQTYTWQFNGDASQATSNLVNPSGISYASAGQKTLSLISTSANGCADTLSTNAVTAYNPPTPPDSCFIYGILDSSIYRGNTAYNNMALTPDGGYVVCSGGENAVVTSRYGSQQKINQPLSAVLSKYTASGVLEWSIYTNNGGSFAGCAVDKNGNIYVTGNGYVNTWVYFANGDSTQIANNPGPFTDNGIVFKVDAKGRLVWSARLIDQVQDNYYEIHGGVGTKIVVQDKNILITGTFNANLAYVKDSLHAIAALANGTDPNGFNNYYIIKLDTSGAFKWANYGGIVSGDPGITGAGMDKNGNAYFCGYSIASEISFLRKYNSSGKLLWNAQLGDGTYFDAANITAMAVDASGNSYITGRCAFGGPTNPPHPLPVYNSDGTQAQASYTPYFLMKFNNAGIYGWGAGSNNAYDGSAGGLAIMLNKDSLYVAGRASGTAVEMTSVHGVSLILPSISTSECFFAQYDTAGSIRRVVSSGPNAGGYVLPHDILPTSNGGFLIGGNLSNDAGGNNHYNIFGNPLYSLGSMDFIFKTSYNFCGAPGFVLPVNIIVFAGQLIKNEALLNWQTGTEINLAQYNIQRSTNGRDFVTVGFVKAENKGSYQYTDPLAGLQDVQKVYYRLEMADKDGKKQYSKIIELRRPAQFTANVYPNPASNKFNVTVNSQKYINAFIVRLFDVAGKQVFAKTITLNGFYYDAGFYTALSNGVYVMEIIAGDEKVVKRVVIAK